jgi:hypothetical protein
LLTTNFPFTVSGPATCTESATAEEDVSGTTRPAHSADLQHGADSDGDREFEKYGQFCGICVGQRTECRTIQMATVDAMKMANKEMKKQYGKIDIDKIEVSIPNFPRKGESQYLRLTEYPLRYGRPDRTSE